MSTSVTHVRHGTAVRTLSDDVLGTFKVDVEVEEKEEEEEEEEEEDSCDDVSF